MRKRKLTPDKEITGLDGLTVGDFWSWAYSDIMGNLNRSVFAEFVVASALGIHDKCRIEWYAYDLSYQGKKIEVKCSAHLQSWQENTPSLIRYDIAKKKSWSAETNTSSDAAVRSSDCYVFCLYPETDPVKADILDVPAWLFFVVPTERIDQKFQNQKTVGLKKLQALCKPVKIAGLREAIDVSLTREGGHDPAAGKTAGKLPEKMFKE
jgi:hypothetical protein